MHMHNTLQFAFALAYGKDVYMSENEKKTKRKIKRHGTHAHNAAWLLNYRLILVSGCTGASVSMQKTREYRCLN